MQKKISCISVYKYLSNHYSSDKCTFLFSCTVTSLIFLSNYFSIPFLVRFQWCDITHLLQTDLGPGNRTICSLSGSWPRFTVNYANQNHTLLALLASTLIVKTEVSPKVVWGNAGTKFLHPRDVLVWSRSFMHWFTAPHDSVLAQIQSDYIFLINALFYLKEAVMIQNYSIRSLSKNFTNIIDSCTEWTQICIHLSHLH